MAEHLPVPAGSPGPSQGAPHTGEPGGSQQQPGTTGGPDRQHSYSGETGGPDSAGGPGGTVGTAGALPPPRFSSKQTKALDLLMSDATDIALGGGARSGKTFLLCYAVAVRALSHKKSRHAIFRFRLNALIASVVKDTLPKVMEIHWPGLWESCHLDKQQWFLTLPNGSEIWFGGLDDKERTEKILGLEFATLYFNECSQIPYASVIMAYSRLAQTIPGLKQKAYYDFNPPTKRHWTYKVFVEKVDPDNPRKPLADGDLYGFLYINPMDNKENLTAAYLRRLENMPARARNRFLLGMFADDSEGLLWTEDVIELGRITGERVATDIPTYQRVIIGVDPSGCSGPEDKRSDEIGIVVVALGTNGHAYVLEDLSGKYGPKEWSTVIADAWERHEADCIVAEVNYGGAMVEATINSLGQRDLNVKVITASRGKVQRAEPIANLYALKEGSKVHHVGYFPELEQQLGDFTTAGYQGAASPDRADALVWAITELFPALVRPMDTVDNTQKHWLRSQQVRVQERSGSSHSRVGRQQHRGHYRHGRP